MQNFLFSVPHKKCFIQENYVSCCRHMYGMQRRMPHEFSPKKERTRKWKRKSIETVCTFIKNLAISWRMCIVIGSEKLLQINRTVILGISTAIFIYVGFSFLCYFQQKHGKQRYAHINKINENCSTIIFPKKKLAISPFVCFILFYRNFLFWKIVFHTICRIFPQNVMNSNTLIPLFCFVWWKNALEMNGEGAATLCA